MTTNNKTGLLNNSKWYNLFKLSDDLSMDLVLKQLNNQNEIYCDFIRELEKDCLMIDDKSGFIKFVDIEKITLKTNLELIAFLDKKNYSFDAEHDSIDVYGYK